MGPEGSLGVRDDLFSEYALDHCYDEMFDRSQACRASRTRRCIAACSSCRPPSCGIASRMRTARSCTRA